MRASTVLDLDESKKVPKSQGSWETQGSVWTACMRVLFLFLPRQGPIMTFELRDYFAHTAIGDGVLLLVRV
jgi:hypothetical protein